MTLHWTYREAKDPRSNLEQGDILWREAGLLRVLSECHSYFCDERYTGFIVLTQTCDLVVRNGNCKAKYISLGVIRELDSLMSEFLSEVCGTEVPGIYDLDRRDAAVSGLKTIINQNEQSRGLFYLHPVTAGGSTLRVLVTRSVALLRITISLRRDHYELLQRARVFGLEPQYAAKLGWLVGNLYSRVPTPDWEDQVGDHAASKRECDDILADYEEEGRENWVSGKQLKLIPKSVILSEIETKRFSSKIVEYLPLPPLDIAASVAAGIAKEIFIDTLEQATADLIASREDVLSQLADEVSRHFTEPDTQVKACECLAKDRAIGNKIAKIIAKSAKAFYVQGSSKDTLIFSEILRDVDDMTVRSRIVKTLKECGLELELPDTLFSDGLRSTLAAYVAGLWEPMLKQADSVATRVKGRLTNKAEFKRCVKAQ